MSFAATQHNMKTTDICHQQTSVSNRLLSPALLVMAGVLTVFACLSTPVSASNIPNLDKAVDFNVREQNVNQFLTALFQEIDVPLAINAELEGNINGQFNDSAGNVFNEVANAFDLLVYYDGAVAQAYRTNQITRRLLPVTSVQAGKVASIVNRMRLPDTRNTIDIEESGVLVSGTERFIAQVEEIIDSVKRQPAPKKKVSKPAPAPIMLENFVSGQQLPIVYQTFKLKHAWAVDTSFPVGGETITIPGVATILGELLLEPEGHNKSVTKDTSNRFPTGLKGQGLAKSRKQTPPQQPARLTLPSVPRIVADSRINAIIIRDHADKMPAYQRLIESLDVESGMVEIEATIIDINTDKTRDLGINWRYQGTDGAVQFGSGGAGDQALIPGNGNLTQGRGGVLSFMLGEPTDFLARIRLLEERGAAKVVSKPHVITLSDVEAVLAATTEFFVRVAGEEEVDLFNVPVGTTLRVTPHVFNDDNINKIKLLVNIEDGSQSAGAQVDSIPVIERANISTQAVINEGDSLLVGGLVRETFRNTGYEVPVLGRVPLIGGLFRSKQNQASRVERLFLITPRLANGIGFGGGNRPALSGNQNRIINDAQNRIKATRFNDRPPITYWSKKSRSQGQHRTAPQPDQSPARATQPLSTIAGTTEYQEIPASKPTAAVVPPRDPRYAVIKNNVFISPFTVEAW